MQLSDYARQVVPFYVMQMMREAAALAPQAAASGQPMIYLNVGEPDFTAPPLVQQAGQRAIAQGRTHYTDSSGLPELRERISAWYAERFGVQVPARRIVVTSGASAALQLACLALLNAGDEVLMADPGYPCNRQFVRMAGAQPLPLPATAAARYQPSAAQIEAALTPRTRAALLASPANPTGTSIAHEELRAIHGVLAARGAALIVDEIYLGLSHDAAFGRSALELGDDIISINSFSKYFCMTGWRLGWMVVPEALLAPVELLAQHLYISPSTPSQYAALACFEPESLAEYERRRAALRARRDWFVPQLERLGLHVPVMPDGAFYVWAQCSAVAEKLCAPLPAGADARAPEHAPSWRLAYELMRRAHIAVTPGRDFGDFGTADCLRFSTASSMEHLQQAVARIRALLEQ